MRKGVIGLGNPLRGDDGISIVLLRKLGEGSLPQDVELFDVGTGGMRALHILEKLDKAIVVDAFPFGGDPGDYVFFEPGEVESQIKPKGPHDSNLLEVLELSKRLCEMPERVLIMGIQPKEITFGEGLSKELEEKVRPLSKVLKDKILEL